MTGSAGHTFWYLTRGSGAIALVLLSASLILGIVGRTSRPGARVPRFAFAAVHRNMSLLTVSFLVLHIITTLADAYAPIGLQAVVVPLTSRYRPVWLGLGAVAFDLVLALVITSLLRVRLGLRAWRLTHWLAYGCWPVAMVHALGTGSDARASWLQLIAAACTLGVISAVTVRLARGGAAIGARLAAAGAAASMLAAGAVFYLDGPGARGWAARAGTPSTLLHVATIRPRTARRAVPAVPARFTARLAGTISEQQTDGGLLDVRIEGALAGGLRGRLRLVLEGVPLDDGGVSMTASGVAFAARGTPVYEGRIVGLDGTRIAMRVLNGAARPLELVVDLVLRNDSTAVSGTVRGTRV